MACVLFDLDGTLVDTTALIFESYRHTLNEVLGYVPTDVELLGHYGRPLPDTMRELVSALGTSGGAKIESATETDRPEATIAAEAARLPVLDQGLVDRLVNEYREFNTFHHDDYIRPFPGVEETLVELRRRGYQLGVVTSKGRRTADLSLRRYGLHRLIDTAVVAEDSSRHKPHPDPIYRALERLGQSPEATLFVGDSVHDLIAGRAAGVRTAAATWGPFPRAELEALRPDYILESISDLLTYCPPIRDDDTQAAE